MSQYVSKLLRRDDIRWAAPGGWRENDDISGLAGIAGNLDISDAPVIDSLSSIPTPWARPLLFEQALYHPGHPAHQSVRAHWRGLLGCLALAGPLRLKIEATSIDLRQMDTRLSRTLRDLRPDRFEAAVGGDPAGGWQYLEMISVDGVTLGATSPATLVFSALTMTPPAAVPFQVDGRLIDPTEYYETHDDKQFLGLLAAWVTRLAQTVRNNVHLPQWFGFVDYGAGAVPESRYARLVDRLDEWAADLAGVAAADLGDPLPSIFKADPYTILRSISPARVEQTFSHLAVADHTDFICGYSALRGSSLVDANGLELHDTVLRLAPGRWLRANQPLPDLAFLAPPFRVVSDPSEFLCETLVRTTKPSDDCNTYALPTADGSAAYLYPFTPKLLSIMSPKRIAEGTSLTETADAVTIRLKIPLVSGHAVVVKRDYPKSSHIVQTTSPAQLVMWPNFVSDDWSHYFYYQGKSGFDQLTFEPVGTKGPQRTRDRAEWYSMSAAAPAFVGSFKEHTGLLLTKIDEMRLQKRAPLLWRVGVDFGSTHTRAFSIPVQRMADNTYWSEAAAEISPIVFHSRAVPLTATAGAAILKRFFVPVSRNQALDELKSILLLPEGESEQTADWLPRDGFVYLASLTFDHEADPQIRTNLKWNASADTELRAFLRCLLLMIQAEAMASGAKVFEVLRSYPSVFTKRLALKHSEEWAALGTFLDGDERPVDSDRALTEAVAVCRHLERDQQAPVGAHVIALDIGGSTTDVGIWSGFELHAQESVRMAGEIVTRYLDSPAASEFWNFVANRAKGDQRAQKVLPDLKDWKGPGSGMRGVVFHSLLSDLEHASLLKGWIESAKETKACHPMIAHITYLFATIHYYAGLLCRSKDLDGDGDNFYLYVCGKGGQFAHWVPAYETIAAEMFSAGLRRGRPAGKKHQVISMISPYAKQEVGRGLLAQSRLGATEHLEEVGLADPRPPSVTVGETGYPGLQWNSTLGPKELEALQQVRKSPPRSQMEELNEFVRQFTSCKQTSYAAELLKLDAVNDSEFRDMLDARLFAANERGLIEMLRTRPDDALIEPLFITEAKVLLQASTRNAIF
jgi:hypothetical protein